MSLNFLSLIIGALLAIAGGAAVEWLKLRMEKKQELSFIKISLSDELEEIIAIINKLSETWDKTSVLHKAYIDDLAASINTYEHCRSRLFLFKDKELRRSIIKFYKNLKDILSESEDKLGSLADTPEAKGERERIKNNFCDIGREAKELIKNLS